MSKTKSTGQIMKSSNEFKSEHKMISFLTSRSFILFLMNLVLFIVLAILKKGIFLDWLNLKAVFSLMTYDLLLAAGMTVILILGVIDLSVGGNLALTSVILALALRAEVSLVLSLLAALATSFAVGFFNGILSTKLKIAPFLVTLGAMQITRGIALVLTYGQYISFPKADKGFTTFGRYEVTFLKLGGQDYKISVLLIISIMLLILTSYLLKNWKPMRQIYFIGENAEAARISGMRVTGISISVFLISALFVFISAVFMTANNRIGYSNYGISSEMRAIAAAVVGGASMSGGKGSLLGTFLGVTLLALVGNAFVLLNGDPNWQQAANGLILILAIIVDSVTNMRKRRG